MFSYLSCTFTVVSVNRHFKIKFVIVSGCGWYWFPVSTSSPTPSTLTQLNLVLGFNLALGVLSVVILFIVVAIHLHVLVRVIVDVVAWLTGFFGFGLMFKRRFLFVPYLACCFFYVRYQPVNFGFNIEEVSVFLIVAQQLHSFVKIGAVSLEIAADVVDLLHFCSFCCVEGCCEIAFCVVMFRQDKVLLSALLSFIIIN